MSRKDNVTRASNISNVVQRAKRFADALAEFRQHIGLMRRLQDAMAKESQANEQYRHRHDGEDDAHLIGKVGRTVGQLEEAWPRVCQARKGVGATVFIPAFPVGGVEPNQWAHGVLAEVSELTELVGGAHASTPQMGMTADQVERYYVLLKRLGEHIRYTEALAVMADAPEVREKDGQLRMLMQDEDAPGKETPDGEQDHAGDNNVASINEPASDAIAAYRACKMMGRKQGEVAAELHTSQGQISRWIQQVDKWRKAGNILPDLPGISHKPTAIDPATIDMGQRVDRRTQRQRQRRKTDTYDGE